MPKDFASLTHRDYVNLCVGYLNKQRTLERMERQAQWLAYVAVSDPKTRAKSIEQWWPIQGEVIRKFKAPPLKQLKMIDTFLRTRYAKK